MIVANNVTKKPNAKILGNIYLKNVLAEFESSTFIAAGDITAAKNNINPKIAEWIIKVDIITTILQI